MSPIIGGEFAELLSYC